MKNEIGVSLEAALAAKDAEIERLKVHLLGESQRWQRVVADHALVFDRAESQAAEIATLRSENAEVRKKLEKWAISEVASAERQFEQEIATLREQAASAAAGALDLHLRAEAAERALSAAREELAAILSVCRENGFGTNSPSAEDAVRQVLQAAIVERENAALAVQQLAAEKAARGEDTERLDWLQRSEITAEEASLIVNGLRWRDKYCGDIRAAIDAARSSSGERKGKEERCDCAGCNPMAWPDTNGWKCRKWARSSSGDGEQEEK